MISLAGGLPAAELLSAERLGNAVAATLQRRGPEALQYGLTAGEPELRELLAADAGVSPDHLMVTAGSQQALDMAFRVLRRGDGNDLAVMEQPGYLGAIQVMRANEFTIEPIPVDADGLQVEVLSERLAAGLRPRVCYINPSFQNPTGACLSRQRAEQLITLAEHYGFLIVADDPYVEIHLDGAAPAPLPASDHVLHLGSMSKTLSPGLRIGWAHGPGPLIDRMALAKQPADLHTSTINQLVVADVMADTTWWSAHLEGLRSGYRLRRAALRSAVERHLPDAVVLPQHGGFFLWLDLGRDTSGLLPRALDQGVAFVPGSAFSVETEPGSSAVRLSYSSGDPTRFDEAIRRLRAA